MGNIKTKELTPVRVDPIFFDALEDTLNKYFKRFIYLPLMQELKPSMRLNNAIDRDVFVEALMKGKVYYYRGYFKGSFNAQVTKEILRIGGVWSAKESGFRVLQEKIPYPIQTAILNSQTAFMKVIERLDKKIQQITPANFAGSIPLEKILEKMIYRTDSDVQESMKGLVISPKLTDQQRVDLVHPYVNKMKADIKGWTEEKMLELRTEIQAKLLAGERYEGMIKSIKDSYGVSQNKAKFLARQETNLMNTQLKEERYKSAGITEYRWRCVAGSPNHPVREMHLIHNNKVFSFDNPPIVNKKGDRKNPTQDYNCRCIAIPIVRFSDEG